ncbi:MAG: hypothetical protein NXI04_17480 [Planctomycetaceae bacterium]|nr:hypothetical protein [Planctomycetaceae bacterium]
MKLGLDGKAYASTTTHASGGSITWTEGDLIEQIEHEDAKGEAKVNNRRSRIEKSGSGQRRISYTLTLTYEADDPFIVLLMAAYENDTVLSFAVMDDDITTSGVKGFYLDVEVFSAPKPENLEEFDKVQFKVMPAAKSTYEPQRVTVA